ncbi:MAG: Crp/Fnr family transcriptional regulator [Anaerolineales bacterium]|nr:Crp/Fnr family transcriptional regulator [Anaerolineales bacterium]
MDKLVGTLSRVWHFRHLSAPALRSIVAAGRLQHFPSDMLLFQECAPSAGMHVLLKGRVHLCKHSPQGHMQIISTIEPVIMFNELSAIDGYENPFTAIAARDCRTWSISHQAFHELMRSYPDPDIGIALMKVLSSRTRALIDRCYDLSSRPVQARLAKLLLELSCFGENTIDRGEYPIKQLAAHIASVPEVVSRKLSAFNDAGIVRCTRQKIHILQPDALSNYAQIDSYPSNETSQPR